MSGVRVERRGSILIVTIDRPGARNAVDRPAAEALVRAFTEFGADDSQLVAVLTGAGGNFCAGADLKAIASDPERANRVDPRGDGPMGPTRMMLEKPVIAAVEGFAVAGGLELALWCDLRIAGESAVFGVFNRRWGVPLIDGGTVRLPRIVGMGRALDMILTGRPVPGREAFEMGLANRVVETGHALEEAVSVAEQIATFPRLCMRSDRASSHEQWELSLEAALSNEFRRGLEVMSSGEAVEGAARFSEGEGRHGRFEDP
ncbi:MAG: crotonase/enoyl-CoA hydratase family protein [Actinomycetota bacterium]